MIEIQTLSHSDGMVEVAITRLGQGRTTRYQIAAQAKQSEAKQNQTKRSKAATPKKNKYTKGAYGHLVRS